MSDHRDRGDGQNDDGESLVPRGRKRRALRVPVDDVPRQSFVDVSRPPSRENVVVPPRAPPAAEAAPVPVTVTTPRQRLPSVEVSLDAELDVEPAPPPRPRSYRPPPPPPTRSVQPPSPPVAEPSTPPEETELAAEPTRVSPSELGAPETPIEIDWGGGHDGQASDATQGARSPWDETTKVGKKRSSAPPSAEAPAMLPDEPLEAPRASSPSIPPPPPVDARPPSPDDDDASFDAIPTAVTHTSLDSRPPKPARPASVPPAAEAPRAPRGLFGGAGSTEVTVPRDEDFSDTVFAPVEEIPRPQRITAAMPARRSLEPATPELGAASSAPRETHASEASAADTRAADTRAADTSAADTSTSAKDASAEGTGAEDTSAQDTSAQDTGAQDTSAQDTSAQDTSAQDTSAQDTSAQDTGASEPSAEEPSAAREAGPARSFLGATPDAPALERAPSLEVTRTPATELDADAGEPEPALELRPPTSGETLVGYGAPEPSVQAVVAIAPVVVVQRAVAVIGSPSSPPPEPRVALTTPGGIGAPIEAPQRESDPGLQLDLEPDGPSNADDAALAEEAEIVEVPISTPAPPKPAPPTQAKPPAPPPAPRPPAPPPTAPAPAIAVEQQPAQAPSRPPPKKKHQWWEELFNDDYLRTVPIPTPKNIAKQCDFIEARLGLAKGATILDVGCGLGLHAIELTRRGFLVVGLDLSLPMLSRAADEAQDQGFKINFLHADMREMNFEGAFDAVLLWGTTLGYFDDDTNRQVLERAYRALKPGGLLLLEVVNRDFAVKSQPNLVWFQGDGCVVMEETSFNFISSRLLVKRNVILDDGRQRETTYSVRLYSLHELGQVLHLRGFRVVEISGREATPAIFFGADSPKLIILAERRVQAAPAPPAPPKKPDDGPKTGETAAAPTSSTPSENGGTPSPT